LRPKQHTLLPTASSDAPTDQVYQSPPHPYGACLQSLLAVAATHSIVVPPTIATDLIVDNRRTDMATITSTCWEGAHHGQRERAQRQQHRRRNTPAEPAAMAGP